MPDDDFELDQERLFTLLDAGQNAQARLAGLAEQRDAIRDAIDKLKVGIEAARSGAPYAERNEHSDDQLAALKEQFRRIDAHREQAIAELSPVIDLARACWAFAKQRRVVGVEFYAL